jgi:hypothetical protein
MPLIEKGILIEGAEGETIIHKYCVNEKAPNPYSDKWKKAQARRYDKARRAVRKRSAPHEKGHTWTMGYNNLVGMYSDGRRYSRFSGSSLNRDKSLKHEKKKDLEGENDNSLALARKIARRYSARGEDWPAELRSYISRQNPETEREFRNWLSDSSCGAEAGIFLPIYVLSPRSRGKIKDKATAFFRSCPGDRVFCTLTFVAPVDDCTGVAILNKFLTRLRREFSSLQYLWVAERQDNGNIHFHIILNKRLPIRKYNALWVLQQYRAGLRGQTQFGERIGLQEVEQRYKDGTIHRIFNPVDVKRVRSISGLSSYLTKYITKQKKTFFSCAPWHCSRGVSRLFTRATVSPSAFRFMMGFGNYGVNKSTGEILRIPKVYRPKGGAAQFCVIVYVNQKDAALRYLREMEQINKWLIGKMQVRGVLDEIDDTAYRKHFCQPMEKENPSYGAN